MALGNLQRMFCLLATWPDRKIPLKLVKAVTYHRAKQKLSPLIVQCAFWPWKMIKKNVFHGHKSSKKHLTAHFSPTARTNIVLAEMKIVFPKVKRGRKNFIHETCTRWKGWIWGSVTNESVWSAWKVWWIEKIRFELNHCGIFIFESFWWGGKLEGNSRKTQEN